MLFRSASRVTGVARPGTVLVAESVREALEGTSEDAAFEWSFAGGRRLKGIKNETKVFRVRRGS